jgi:hypothetical protein
MKAPILSKFAGFNPKRLIDLFRIRHLPRFRFVVSFVNQDCAILFKDIIVWAPGRWEDKTIECVSVALKFIPL